MPCPGKRAVVVLILMLAAAAAAEPSVLFREDFDSLDRWEPYYFPKIAKHSTYTIEKNGKESVLRAESNASASAIVFNSSFDVREYPKARWRWKVKNVYAKADPHVKTGDDYPIRIYIMFEYDPEKAGLGDRILFGMAKMRFGVYPPQASLSYVWSSTVEKERIVPSPYTDRARSVLLRMGAKDVGRWKDEEVDMLEDFRKAFGTEPPGRARIAIMSDSDNTGESAVAWVDYIEVYK